MDDTGTRQEFPGGGMRDTAAGKERFELLWTEGQPYEEQMVTRAARWMARGAEKYDSRNWELFDSPEALEHAKASLLRHTFKLLAGHIDEDHAAAVWFNSQVIEYVRWKLNQKLELGMLADAIAYEIAMTPPTPVPVVDTPWCPGDLVEYDDYGAKFRGCLRKHDGGNCWTGVVTEIESAGSNEGLAIGETVAFVEGHSTKIAHGSKETNK